jgi:hypothetical protein
MKKNTFKRIMFPLLFLITLVLTACAADDVINVYSQQDIPDPVAIDQPQGQAPSISAISSEITYPIVDTGQGFCYENGGSIPCPSERESFYGQDGQYRGLLPSYTDNGDGTVTDNNTGLMWQQDPGAKMTYQHAVDGADSFTLAGYDDWRLPTIKELYSLILFSGVDPSGWDDTNSSEMFPFIDTDYFAFEYGSTTAGERVIDSQWATSTLYVSSVMNGQQAMFGVNFADGRIKGYPTNSRKTYFVIYVRGNGDYGVNDFVDNGDGTITDQATGLTWMQNDSGSGMVWENALNYCENLKYAGASDWRLPDAKQLQSIVDYSRSPDTTNSAAITPLFIVTTITNEAGLIDYPSYWSSTTHANVHNGMNAVYVSFGRTMGYMQNTWIDVHGAGAQRSDPKTGDPSAYATGHGPQGDAIRIYNYARCVRTETALDVITGGETNQALSGITTQPSLAQGQPGVGSRLAQGVAPPQEAINACIGQNSASACTFNTPDGTLNGTCTQIESQLACVPEGGPPGNPGP